MLCFVLGESFDADNPQERPFLQPRSRRVVPLVRIGHEVPATGQYDTQRRVGVVQLFEHLEHLVDRRRRRSKRVELCQLLASVPDPNDGRRELGEQQGEGADHVITQT